MSKSKKQSKTSSKKSAKPTIDAATKKVLAVTGANLARIEAQERGEAPPPPESDGKATKAGGKNKAAKAKAEKPKRVSALDAAAQVLAGSKEPLTSQDLIKAMAEQKLWTSPGGKTPHATLYAAIIREISTKGKDARFKKVDRGMFTAAKGA